MAEALITVVELKSFEAAASGAGVTEVERKELTDFVARNPEWGAVISGTGGLRKLRWARRGTGKRGGYRVIYYYYSEAFPIYLFTIYTKAEQEDLTPDEKKQLAAVVGLLKAEAKSRRGW